jgi:F0F1-type ATP synthase assembly protein I
MCAGEARVVHTPVIPRPRATDVSSTSMRIWSLLVVGAVIGLALGILVSAFTDVPFAPEVGVVLGALVGWLLHRAST